MMRVSTEISITQSNQVIDKRIVNFVNLVRGDYVIKNHRKIKYLYTYIYETNTYIMSVETKLTTVKIIKGVYSTFKQVSFESDVTLQKLVNRTVERYVTDEDFRNEMNEYLKLQISGSQF